MEQPDGVLPTLRGRGEGAVPGAAVVGGDRSGGILGACERVRSSTAFLEWCFAVAVVRHRVAGGLDRQWCAAAFPGYSSLGISRRVAPSSIALSPA